MVAGGGDIETPRAQKLAPPTAHYWALCTTSGPNTEMKDEKEEEPWGEELITAADDDDDRCVGEGVAGDCPGVLSSFRACAQ